ncbi:ACT domain-containing protein [Haloechinothrix sp. LS1_15]|uniref:ACT domain-containing protein n=1 Tax=Haloechinothrix sp. LS1_15 TaxID=2652248 RepID=UPI002944A1DB|nr:ACT domain-containing protein [Haloechinothrix sp. LS1_15]MDV6012155.1 ACT domain-containing protein [Haloechinothrix sp. LS1_15]
MRRLAIDVMPGEYAVARLDAHAEVPTEVFAGAAGSLVSVTRTGEEISVIGPAGVVAELAGDTGVVERGWRLLSIRGPLEFTLTGIIAAIASELAAAGVALFSLSTFDTDHVLVRQDNLTRATLALQDAGHEVHGT